MDFTRPKVMGILNVTPDSFYKGMGAWRHGGMERIVAEGAYIIDIGAVSTRPGAVEVSIEEEKRRLIPVLKETRRRYPDIIISIDTYRAEIAAIAAAEGADMINDISGGTMDPGMITAIIRLGIPYIIMHIQGVPGTMQVNPVYENVTEEVAGFLLGQAKKTGSSRASQDHSRSRVRIRKNR
jgi:dihydropteroate synthase